MALEISRAQHGESQVVALRDHVDETHAQHGTVEFHLHRHHLDRDVVSGRGAMNRLVRAFGPRRVRSVGLRGQVTAVEAQELGLGVTVSSHGGVVHDQDPAGVDRFSAHRARVCEKESPVTLDGCSEIALRARTTGQQRRQEEPGSRQEADETPHDFDRLAPGDAAEGAELQAEADRRAGGEHQRSGRGDRDAESQRGPDHKHQRERQQREARGKARKQEGAGGPADGRQHPQGAFASRGGIDPAVGAHNEGEERYCEHDAGDRVRPPAHGRSERRWVHDEHVAVAIDACFLEHRARLGR